MVSESGVFCGGASKCFCKICAVLLVGKEGKQKSEDECWNAVVCSPCLVFCGEKKIKSCSKINYVQSKKLLFSFLILLKHFLTQWLFSQVLALITENVNRFCGLNKWED